MKDRVAEDKSFDFLEYRSSDSLPDDSVSEIAVKHNAFWSYCGPVLTEPSELPPNLHEWAAAALSGSITPVLLPFLTFANDFAANNGLDHYWLTIRATQATSEFNKPRWHTDELFFSSNGGGLRPLSRQSTAERKLDLQTDWKMCTTLLGPATMFIPAEHQAEARELQRSAKRALATDHACDSIRCVGCAATADAVRDRLANTLASLGVVQAAPGACSFFRIGEDGGAVHSEPCMSEGDRIFVNVVPGKREELASLMTKWGMSFPRAWWIAPNVPRGHRRQEV